MSMKTTFLKIGVPFIIIAAGIIVMKSLVSTRQAPVREVREDPGILVEVFKAGKEDTTVMVRGTGTVEPAQEVSVIPQVSGRVVYTAPDLDVGGFFEKDDVLFEIEDTDYRLALERAVSSRAKAEYELATIESQAQIAREEWKRINNADETPPNPLVLYEPQLKSAKAALAAADAQIEQAMLDLERTKIRAPFNARVRSEDIDVGQYVKSGSSVAVLAGTDSAEIAVPLPLDELGWLSVPRRGERQNGADTAVNLNIGGTVQTWSGHVVRTTGEVDPRTRMTQLIVEIRDPYGLETGDNKPAPTLAAGSFVEVLIKGKTLRDVIVIPRTTLRDNETVWVMDRDSKLQIREVNTLRLEKDKVIIGEGIKDGEIIVLTNISGAANGMKLRTTK